MTLKEKLFLIILGCCAFSSLCSYITMNIFKTPICLVEIFYIPLLFVIRKNLEIPSHNIIFLIFILLGFTLLGYSQPIYELKDILPTTRCFFYGCLAYIIARNNKISLKLLFYLSFGVVIGDLINGYIQMSTMYLSHGEDKEYALDINIIFSVLFIVMLVLYKEKMLYTILAGLLIPIIGFFSVSRGISMFFIVAYGISVINKIAFNQKLTIPIVTVVAIISVLTFNFYEKYEYKVKEISPSIHYRLYTKTSEINSTNSDENRVAAYKYALNNMDRYIVPRGFIGKKFIFTNKQQDKEYMYPWDSSLLELLYTLGILIVPTYIIILKRFFSLCQKREELESHTYEILISMLFVILIESFFGYGLLKNPYTITSLGLILGKCTSRPEVYYV